MVLEGCYWEMSHAQGNEKSVSAVVSWLMSDSRQVDRKMLLLTPVASGHGMGQPVAPQHHGRSKASFLLHLRN